MLPWLLLGCRATLPDVGADAARLTGVRDAITFRENAEAINPATHSGGLLTPARAVRLALAHDPRIQAGLARVRVAEADANQARLLPNPILSIDLRYPLTSGGNAAFEPTLTADLIAILQKPAQTAAADNRLRESASNALVIVLDVMSEVQDAYASARSADAEIVHARRRRERLQRLHELAANRLAAGEATRLDVLTVDAQLMQSALEMADFELARVEQRLILARLLGAPRSDADWELSPWEPPTGPLAPESAWVDAALRNRPEIQARVWELRALGEDLSVAALAPLQGGTLGAHGEHDPEWRLGPTLSVPLPVFDFGQAGRAKVKASRVAARHDLAQQQLDAIQNVRSSYAGYSHFRQSLADAQNLLLPLQRQTLEQAQLAYKAGEADLTTLLLAQNEFDLTQARIIELQEKVTSALVKLQRAAGGAGVAVAAVGPGAEAATRPALAPALDPLEAPLTRPADPTAANRVEVPATEPVIPPATRPVELPATEPVRPTTEAATSQPATGPAR